MIANPPTFHATNRRESAKLPLMFHPYNILAGILFGGVGMGAFMYGKKLELWQPLVIGLALMSYSWFVTTVWLTWAIGVGLCVLLWFFHSE